MKTVIIIAAMLLGLYSQAQVKSVNLQASGLTCSMCSNSINKALKTVAFVEKVVPNIKTSTFEITFKPGEEVDFDLLKKKVEDAGFSVSKFLAIVSFNNVAIVNNLPVTVGNKTFRFINVKDQSLTGDKAIRIIDKGFVTPKELKKTNLSAAGNGQRIYNATI
ncbi:MAG: heavy metal-associated domain-containing protein [Ginsengibacter sp.]